MMWKQNKSNRKAAKMADHLRRDLRKPTNKKRAAPPLETISPSRINHRQFVESLVLTTEEVASGQRQDDLVEYLKEIATMHPPTFLRLLAEVLKVESGTPGKLFGR
jgi:hypothetical protein